MYMYHLVIITAYLRALESWMVMGHGYFKL